MRAEPQQPGDGLVDAADETLAPGGHVEATQQAATIGVEEGRRLALAGAVDGEDHRLVHAADPPGGGGVGQMVGDEEYAPATDDLRPATGFHGGVGVAEAAVHAVDGDDVDVVQGQAAGGQDGGHRARRQGLVDGDGGIGHGGHAGPSGR